ncbi:hypothetical protein [Spirillospora sp. NPDC048823]|uniref:hypothetical protein n=1 Tax=unclassified Spirillospora TaxID=2642701 RepID=UPI00371A63CE
MQPGLLETQHADVLRRLGDLTAAQAYVEESVRTGNATHLRGQAHRLATLAQVQGERGSADEAAATGQRMLEPRCCGGSRGRGGDRLAARSMEPLTVVHPTPGISDSRHHIFLACGATHIGVPVDDWEAERIEWVPLADIQGLVEAGEIVSGTSMAALLLAAARRKL